MPLPAELLAQLPEDLRADPSLAAFNDLAGLAKSYRETKSLVGASVRPPGPDATPEAKLEFRNHMMALDPDLVVATDENLLLKRLGKPEKAEDYEVPPEAQEAGLNAQELRALALEAGLTRKQAKALATLMANGALSQKEAATKEQQALKAEWGAAFEEKTLAARAAAMKQGLSEQDAMALTPKMLKAFASVAKATGVGGGEFRDQTGAGPTKLTPDEAKTQLAEIRANPAFWDRSKNPLLHDQLVKKSVELTGMAYPS